MAHWAETRLNDYTHSFYQKVQDGYTAEKVKDGVFQAHMLVASVNDGPVSLERGFISAVKLCCSTHEHCATDQILSSVRSP